MSDTSVVSVLEDKNSPDIKLQTALMSGRRRDVSVRHTGTSSERPTNDGDDKHTLELSSCSQ